MSQFLQDQEATTKMYLLLHREGVDAGIAEIGSYPLGLRQFCRATLLLLGAVALATNLLVAPRISAKLLATRAGYICEMGSNSDIMEKHEE